MKIKYFSIAIILSFGILASSCGLSSKKEIPLQVEEFKKPNVVIIFLDDSGYSDFNPFGQVDVPTPTCPNGLKSEYPESSKKIITTLGFLNSST